MKRHYTLAWILVLPSPLAAAGEACLATNEPDDLPDSAKEEIINRTRLAVG